MTHFIHSLPEECILLIFDKMDQYSQLSFSMTSKQNMKNFYSKKDADAMTNRFKHHKIMLHDCHTLIRNIYDNNVLTGWCELCCREKLLRSSVSHLLGEENVIWKCIDHCKYVVNKTY